MERTTDSILPIEKIDVIIGRIRKFYLILVCLVGLSILSRLSEFNDSFSQKKVLDDAIGLIIFICIYAGLKSLTKWAIPLILFTSAMGLLRAYLKAIQPIENVTGILIKLVSILYILFCTYQLIFFTRKEVKYHFDAGGTILF
jgi:hypothetical protein